MMRVVLSFDVEMWCEGWDRLDERFPGIWDAAVNGVPGRGARREYGLRHILWLLERHQLKGVFLVEPLFAARFGRPLLRRLVRMIQEAGQEVQMHLHPEWADEILPCPLPGERVKRAMLAQYEEHEQLQLLQLGCSLLEEADAPRPTVFRAGNFGANSHTLAALGQLGFRIDSSFNASCTPHCRDLPRYRMERPFESCGVWSIPVSPVRDFRGRIRHAQVGACGLGELCQGLERAHALGQEQFVLLAHNFELIDRRRRVPNPIVAHRMAALCAFLDRNRAWLPTAGFAVPLAPAANRALPRIAAGNTLIRFVEQALQRLPLPPSVPFSLSGDPHA